MAATAREAGIKIIAGDTKVVNRGACDRLFITTTGIGTIRSGVDLGAHRVQAGDVVLVNGLLGDHGAAILAARGDMALETPIESDCAPLHDLIGSLLAAAPATRLFAMLNNNFGAVGSSIVALFIACWIASYFTCKVNDFDRIKVRSQ